MAEDCANDEAPLGLHQQHSFYETGPTSYFALKTFETFWFNMDMPMNVPVDDPNADTEWYECLLLLDMGND